MIKFLLSRPIAVLMAFTAFFLIGLATYFTLPVSLLPDIAIPEITVQVTSRNTSARELENTIVRPIRQQLLQVASLRNIESNASDGGAVIRLSFEFGTNTDLAFIEVNEKIDAAMSYIPRETERPRVIKASATDIPVFYLNLTLRREHDDVDRFLELSDFAGNVIKRRIEQLPEIAMVDMTGTLSRQLQIVPDMNRLASAGFSLSDLEQALAANNVEAGSMVVRDGYYEYNIKFSTLLRSEEDVREIYLRKQDRIFQLKDLAEVSIIPRHESGASLARGKRAVTLAVIKQGEDNMAKMKESLQRVMKDFQKQYPDIEFSITRNQTELLDFTISNLKQNLLLGFILIFMVSVLFLGDVKSPFVIALSMVVSIVVSFLFFYLFGMTLNIISLSGLILALGMMIDSGIIVTENISQYRSRGYSLEQACDRGTTEVITPMLSSTFTTIAVFVPLVFMSGIAGAIFYDQAFAVTVGLLVSYFTGIMLLPVLYQFLYGSVSDKFGRWFRLSGVVSRRMSQAGKLTASLDCWYDRWIDFAFRHKRKVMLFCFASLPLCAALFLGIPKSGMPELDHTETVVNLEWNDRIHLDENRRRTEAFCHYLDSLGAHHTAYVGTQQFLLNRENELTGSEAEVYVRMAHAKEIAGVECEIRRWLTSHYPEAIFSFSPPGSLFEKIFVTGEADLVAAVSSRKKDVAPEAVKLHELQNRMREATGEAPEGVTFDNQLNLSIEKQKLLLYNVDYNEVYRVLKTAFRENEVALLRSYQQYLPITLSEGEQSLQEVLRKTMIRTNTPWSGSAKISQGSYPSGSIPLNTLVRVIPTEDLKTIHAGKNGEFIPFRFYRPVNPELVMEQVRALKGEEWNIDFTGSFFTNRKMLSEMVVILLISVLLMYFILAAQFESFSQPLIVLLEIPVDTAAALGILWLCGHTLNLMSAIGIVVTCGIIINDSILKLDMINELRKAGLPLMEAIHEAGRRRLRPIIMTSLTTVFAMVPILFTFDMGSELQQPLAIGMIAAMVVGTLVSLFVIPVVYYYIAHLKLSYQTKSI
ncbi:MAG: efflux RND transporter permease subunit [Bacteroidales bacterium]